MTKQAWFFLFAIAAAAAAVACGSSNFAATDPDSGTVQPDATVDDGSSGEDTGAETSLRDSAPPPDDGGTVFEGSADTAPPDAPVDLPDAGDSGCSDVPSDVVGSVVSTTGTGDPSTQNGCSTSTPCPSIQGALGHAAKFGRTIIYVDEGTYKEALTLSTGQALGITIQGGWRRKGGTWTHVCDGSAIPVIEAPAGAPAIVTANNSGTFTLQLLRLLGNNQVTKSASNYGIFASGATTKLTLVSVNVEPGPGADGNPGILGSTGANAPGSCSAGSPVTPAAGTPGAGALAGMFTSAGYGATNGSTGGAGGAGGNGTVGALNCMSCVDSVACSNESPPCSMPPNIQVCGDPGIPGCGSGGGGPGTPGTGGGSSVAVFVWGGASVSASYTHLIPRAGGVGAPGGNGGPPGTPSAGAQGGSQNCTSSGTCSVRPPAGTDCYVSSPVTKVVAGSIGTAGAAGSVGGKGGGGSGGSTYGYYTGGGGTFTEGASLTWIPGAAGSGGGGVPPAASGVSAAHN